MYSLSLSNPSEYFKMREKISESLTEDIVTSLYNKIYLLLREGKIADKSVTGGLFVGYPSNKVNSLVAIYIRKICNLRWVSLYPCSK